MTDQDRKNNETIPCSEMSTVLQGLWPLTERDCLYLF